MCRQSTARDPKGYGSFNNEHFAEVRQPTLSDALGELALALSGDRVAADSFEVLRTDRAIVNGTCDQMSS